MLGIPDPLTLGLSFEARSFRDLIWDWRSPRSSPRPLDDPTDVLLVGGNSENKGAQAMTFTVVDELQRQFGDVDVHLLLDPSFETGVEDRYAFEVWEWLPESKANLYSGGLLYDEAVSDELSSLFRRADCLIDISGYALSSQWGIDGSISYLMNIMAARARSVPYAIFPQSIGPFNYGPIGTVALWSSLRTSLRYPFAIYPREQYGVEAVQPYTKTTPSQQFDIVLQHGEYALENIYEDRPEYDVPSVEEGAVAIVPNVRLLERTDSDEIFALYERIASSLTERGHSIYVLRHSSEDTSICEEIARRCEPADVRAITADLDAIALEGLIAEMDFLVASRYHSIIHAYKNGVPAVVLGWAEKYRYLLEHFDQREYFHDGRTGVDSSRVLSMVRSLSESRDDESNRIERKHQEILDRTFFESFFDRWE